MIYIHIYIYVCDVTTIEREGDCTSLGICYCVSERSSQVGMRWVGSVVHRNFTDLPVLPFQITIVSNVRFHPHDFYRADAGL